MSNINGTVGVGANHVKGTIGASTIRYVKDSDLYPAIDSYLEENGGALGTQPDLAQNDETQPDYVKNRTHWVEENATVEIMPECQPTYDESDQQFFVTENVTLLTAGETYIVNWNGTEYTCVGQNMGLGLVAIGDCTLYGFAGNDEPFLIGTIEQEGINCAIVVPFDGSTTLTISINKIAEVVHKLDNKYLDLDWLPVFDDVGKEILPKTEFIGKSKTLSINIFDDLEIGDTVIVYADGSRYESVAFGEDEPVSIGNLNIVNSENPSTGEPFCILNLEGHTYCGFATKDYHTIAVYLPGNSQRIARIIPDEFLPGSVILRSSTGSGKKFRLTVNDNGEMSVTEVS